MNIQAALDWLEGKAIEDNGCLVWDRNYGGAKRDTPMIRVNGGNRSVKRYLWELMTGKKLKKGKRVFCNCESVGCVHPEHIEAKTYCAHQKGKKIRADVRLRMTKTKREQSRFNEAAIESIKRAELNERQAKELFGMSRDHFYKIKSGDSRRDYSNPFAGLGA